MKQRFHVAWASTFTDAVSLKHFHLIDEPEMDFQIRRKKDRFELVKRLSVKASKILTSAKETATQYSKKKKKTKVRGW